MGRVLTVREFDFIVCNPEYSNEYTYLPDTIFWQLAEFIRSFTGTEGQVDPLTFFKIGYKRNIGDIISVGNYVGVIQLDGGYQIEVLPKISIAKEDQNGEITKEIFLHMLRYMKDLSGKFFLDAELNISKMNLYELFIHMYLQELKRLVRRGIKSTYINREENLDCYKGKLYVKEHIRQNLIHLEKFYMTYDEYDVNRPENKILKATLEKLQKQTESPENQNVIRQLLLIFGDVRSSSNYQSDFSKVAIDRTTRHYEEALRWSKVFLMNKSFSTFSGETKARSLLFPMEKVYEVYVARKLQMVLEESSCRIIIQDKGYYLFDFPKKFALKPDIVITRHDGTKIVLDTKWKSLIDRPKTNYGISQSDMYQVYTYAKKYEATEVYLLYPLNEEMRGHDRICFRSDDAVTVKIFFVDLENIDRSMEELKRDLNISKF
mgnify:CR=1 FL=1